MNATIAKEQRAFYALITLKESEAIAVLSLMTIQNLSINPKGEKNHDNVYIWIDSWNPHWLYNYIFNHGQFIKGESK